MQSSEEIEARERAKREAAMKRERARAYAVVHQAQVINENHRFPCFVRNSMMIVGWWW